MVTTIGDYGKFGASFDMNYTGRYPVGYSLTSPGNGNIYLATDDDMHLEGATIGGPTFTGTIRLEANRDNANEQHGHRNQVVIEPRMGAHDDPLR
jgi:hypothetical protein